MAATLPAGVASLHTADYRRPDQLPPGGVLVVGSAQSGGQVAEDLLDAGRNVFISASVVGRLPRRYRGRDIFEWLVPAHFFDQTVDQLPDPRLRLAAQPMLSGVGRYGHTLSLQLLRERGAVLHGRLLGNRDGRSLFELDLAASVAAGDRGSADIRELIERTIAVEGLDAGPLEHDRADESWADLEALTSPAVLDFANEGIASVLWATGFGADLSWINLPVADATGAVLHDAGRSFIAGLWFLGLPWLRSRGSGMILGADRDGAVVAAQVAAHLAGARR
jgi:putative flavoprotein involved in K+ transport